MNIVYLRVSKEEEKLQDITQQKDAIFDKFDIDKSKCLILSERGSAYNMDKIHKRKMFLELLDKLFNSEKTTIKDLYLGNYEKKEINLYVWDYHRIMRNFEFTLLFGLLADFFNIQIYSYKQGKINKEEEETPLTKFSRYIFFSINAFSAEDYSYTISTNIKKAIKKKDGVTYGTKHDPQGRKWGPFFKDPQGNKKRIPLKVVISLNERILSLCKYYKKRKIQFFYDLIIAKIRREFNIDISKAYITGLRK